MTLASADPKPIAASAGAPLRPVGRSKLSKRLLQLVGFADVPEISVDT